MSTEPLNVNLPSNPTADQMREALEFITMNDVVVTCPSEGKFKADLVPSKGSGPGEYRVLFNKGGDPYDKIPLEGKTRDTYRGAILYLFNFVTKKDQEITLKSDADFHILHLKRKSQSDSILPKGIVYSFTDTVLATPAP